MTILIAGLLIPLAGTMLGASFVFLMRGEMPSYVQKSLLGFASGVMVAASVWSLLIPSMEMVEKQGRWSVFPAAVGAPGRIDLAGMPAPKVLRIMLKEHGIQLFPKAVDIKILQ